MYGSMVVVVMQVARCKIFGPVVVVGCCRTESTVFDTVMKILSHFRL